MQEHTQSEPGQALDLKAVPRLAEATIHRKLEDETMILNIDDGHYYVLNETASTIWDLCDGKRTLGDIISALCSHYNVTTEAAQASVARPMNDLVQVHLIVLDGGEA